MLDYAIAFFLGLTLAALVALAMVPAIWARARRLIRRQMETALPLSMAQVRAAQDHVRAEAAIAQRRLEQRLELERSQRHELMADYGRQSERLRRVEVIVGIDAARLAAIEQGAAAAQRNALAAEQVVASLKAELAAARVTLALRDDMASEHEREIHVARVGNDNLRVEVVALRTKLGAVEDIAFSSQRELRQAQQQGSERDDRLALQAINLMRRETAIAALEARAASLQHELLAMTRKEEAVEVEKSDLETRIIGLSADLRRKDAAMADRDARLAIASGREAELNSELNRIKRSAAEPSVAEEEITALKAERSRLQSELAALRQEAHDSWLRIEADNRMLRREMAQIAAEIAREVASRQSVISAPAAERVAANDQAASDAGTAGSQPGAT